MKKPTALQKILTRTSLAILLATPTLAMDSNDFSTEEARAIVGNTYAAPEAQGVLAREAPEIGDISPAETSLSPVSDQNEILRLAQEREYAGLVTAVQKAEKNVADITEKLEKRRASSAEEAAKRLSDGSYKQEEHLVAAVEDTRDWLLAAQAYYHATDAFIHLSEKLPRLRGEDSLFRTRLETLEIIQNFAQEQLDRLGAILTQLDGRRETTGK